MSTAAVSFGAPARGSGRILLLAALAVALVALTAVGPVLHQRLGGWALIGIFAASAAGALAAARLSAHAHAGAALAVIAVGAVAMRAGALLHEPSLSSDVYRYVWDGRVAGAGINPYRFVPAAPELAVLRDPAIFPNINRASYATTIYPPVAQAIFLAVTRLGDGVLVMRIAMVAFEAITCAALVALLRRLGAPATDVVLYAWHPLPIWEIAGNGHVDAAMVALLMLALLLAVAYSTLAAAIAATLAALVKPTAALALAVLWKPWDWRLPLAVAATLLVAYLPYASVGWGVLGYLPGYVTEEGLTTGGAYKLISLLQSLTGRLPYAAPIYIGGSCLLLLCIAIACCMRRDRSATATVRALNLLLTAFLVLSSPHYPWYFLVLVPLLALRPTATGWVLTVASVLFYDAVPEIGTLPSYDVRVRAFTLMMLLALARDAWLRRDRPRAATGETP
jgi:alpha-1,6-mannosyltransferase